MSKVLYRDLNKAPLRAVGSSGLYIEVEGGKKILDAIGGAAVTAIGHSNQEVVDEICEAFKNVQFAHSSLFTTDYAEELASIILDKPYYEEIGLGKVAFFNSGSEANETAFKVSRQACFEKGEPQRTKIISRNMSYHGNTFGAMQLSGHKIRNKKFVDIFDEETFHKVSPPFYRYHKQGDETEEEFCQRLLDELDAKFQEIGPDTVMAFVAETMIGGTVGCVLPPKGYFEGVKKICHKYGAYVIYDEVMCGSGRLGSFFAWEQLTDKDHYQDVVPDILTFGKAIGSGYLPLAGVVVHENLLNDLKKGSAAFMSRQTFQSHPMACAAGLAVQKYIKKNNLYDNINKLGPKFGELLKSEFSEIPEVCDVRGKGFFWSVEFMKDPSTTTAFDPAYSFTDKLAEKCMENGLAIMACHGCIDGENGDQIVLAPSFESTQETLAEIVSRLKKSVIELLEYIKVNNVKV